MYEELIRQGIRFEDEGMVDNAKEFYLKAAEFCPNKSAAWELLGDLHWNLRDFKSAADYYSQAYLYEPEHIEHLESLALCLAYSNQRNAAAEKMALYLEKEQGSRTFLYNYGVTLRRIGRPAEAIDTLEKARLLEGDSPTASTLNALGAALLDLGDLAKSKVCFLSALAIEPENSMILGNIGELYKREGRRDESLEFFKRSLAIDPDDVAVREAFEQLLN